MNRPLILLLALALLPACQSSGSSGGDDDTDTGADSDSDADTDNDTDSDSDSDSDSDTETSTTSDCTQPEATPDCVDGWCRIEPGCFLLGSPVTEPCRGAYSETQVQVTLTRPFLISQHELTQAEWESVGFPNPSATLDGQLPIVFIDWFEAAAYANALSEAEALEPCYDLSDCQGTIGSGCPDGYGSCSTLNNEDVFVCEGEPHVYSDWYSCNGYRLPTTAEWEYAARAGTTTSTYNGEVTTDSSSCQEDPVVEPIAWYCANSDMMLQQACGKQANGWGLYDMLGNAMEWIDYVYTGFSLEWGEGQDGPLVDPQGADFEQDDRRSQMGGVYGMPACDCRAANHFAVDKSERTIAGGTRLVRTILTD